MSRMLPQYPWSKVTGYEFPITGHPLNADPQKSPPQWFFCAFWTPEGGGLAYHG